MAFSALATADDLAARNIAVPSTMTEATLLSAASQAVREAAGCSISQASSTVALAVDDLCRIDLPGVPVTAVSSVLIEGTAVPASTLTSGYWSDGWRLSGSALLLKNQWAEMPATVTVSYTHGFLTIPEDIVDLVCGMVAIAVATGGDGYGMVGRSRSVRLGEYSETFATPSGTESPSPFALPDRTVSALRARFGTSAVMVSVG